jgi:hypothetical protein
MKLLKSKCEKVWLFDANKEEFFIRAGLACFLSDCPSSAIFKIEDEEYVAILPFKVAGSATPARILNARLPLQ